jgi:hypothetical protein
MPEGRGFTATFDKIEGDRLTICLPGGRGESPGRPRPKEFDGGQALSLIVLERIKDK